MALGKYKICVYAISKNEEQFVDRWMDAVSEADLVVVLDTGSTDETVKKLKKRGAKVYQDKIDPWRFDTARNTAMDHIPEDVDICISNDLDEVFEPGWREKLETAWNESCTRGRYLFTCNYNPDGTPAKQYPMEKIHLRHGFRWVHPVHEVLQYTGKIPDRTVWVPGLVLNHHPDPKKSRGQYLPLLELSAKENPQDDRVSFWLGREYVFYKKYEEAIQELTRYLSLPSAVWDEERSAAMRFIARAYQEQSKKEEAKAWLFRAAAECPHIREPYVALAYLGYAAGDWHLLYFAANRALKIQEKTGSYLEEVTSWGQAVYDLAAIGAYRVGLYEESLAYAKHACDLAPQDKRLQNNLKLIQEKCDAVEG